MPVTGKRSNPLVQPGRKRAHDRHRHRARSRAAPPGVWPCKRGASIPDDATAASSRPAPGATANFSRDSTSSNSASSVALLHSSKACVPTPLSRRRGGPPGDITPDTSVFVSSTTRTVRHAGPCGPGVPPQSPPRYLHPTSVANSRHQAVPAIRPDARQRRRVPRRAARTPRNP